MPPEIFKRGRAGLWTLERLAQLSAADIKQLRENAERLGEPELVARCSEALTVARARTAAGKARKA